MKNTAAGPQRGTTKLAASNTVPAVSFTRGLCATVATTARPKARNTAPSHGMRLVQYAAKSITASAISGSTSQRPVVW